MNANDIAILREMFAEQERKFSRALQENAKRNDGQFSVIEERSDEQHRMTVSAIAQSRTDIVREIREETRAMLLAAEKRIINTVVGSIGEILDTSVLPQIAELQRDMTTVKQHLQLA